MVRRDAVVPAAVAFFATTLFSNVSATMSSSKTPLSLWGGPIVRCGHVKKLKTQKKKYFVLRGEAPGFPACLEYFDSEKKFASGQPPKRRILLDSCFNINQRGDTKHKHVIALYTKDECFCLILENKKELDEWLNAMLLLQSGDVPDGEQPRPIFEHVWGVTVQKKGLGERKNINGPYRLCLTDRTLSLVKMEAKDNSDCIEFPLNCIRRCGCIDNIFYMEVGRSAVTGGGELWMEAEDNNIARNMNTTIMIAMSNCTSNKEDVGPRQRMRSSSATEASKPIFVLQRRHGGQKFPNFSPLGEEHRTHKEKVDALQEQKECSQTQSTSSSNTITGANGRDRCDSLPSRARTTSESHPGSVVLSHPRNSHFVASVPRPHSMYGRGLSYSPPGPSMPISPASRACSTDSAGSSLSMDDGGENIHSLTPEEHVIHEENGDDYAPPNSKSHSPSQRSSYIEMYSPCGSSPGRGGCYIPRSFGAGHSHSRGSSLVEETNGLPDGYVPMAPVGNNGYVDMDPTHNHNGHFPDDMSHGGSTCSVTSGTPSTDMRFSEYHLDKVPSFLQPGDDLPARPARAYSIGSRPEPTNRHRKNRLDIAHQDSSRVRAFSVGSRSKKPELGRLANIITVPLPSGSGSSSSTKSNSAPLLSSSWGHNSGCSITSERMEDLMELDFTRPSISTTLNSPLSSYSQSHSQSHSYSTATDTSSYVDMSPGQPPTSTTAPYVDMSRMNKINRNNNNNTIAANQNHSHMHVLSSGSNHKPVITTLKPVEEAEGPYMRMDGPSETWSRLDPSPKQILSPMQDDSLHMNGPPGGKRTAPMDLPRRPSSDYVEMNSNFEQDYINMNMSNRTNRKTPARTLSCKEKLRSQPIAILAGNKPVKAPSFLPLNGSPESESLASTPASPPRATPTGSSATIFPFSLNSPQSPEKSFAHQKANDESSKQNTLDKGKESGILESGSRALSLSSTTLTETSNTPQKVGSNEKAPSPLEKDKDTVETRTSTVNPVITSQDKTMSTLIKKFPDLLVSKPSLVTALPNSSSTLSEFNKSSTQVQPASPKATEETAMTSVTVTTVMSGSGSTDTEGYEKLQSGTSILHYASLDLPEKGNAAPVSPASQESFNYVEIDFAKLKQN